MCGASSARITRLGGLSTARSISVFSSGGRGPCRARNRHEARFDAGLLERIEQSVDRSMRESPP